MKTENESKPVFEVGKAKEPILLRLHRAIGPIAGGLILDLVDLSTFGPFGIVGLFVGCAVGWWVSSIYHLSRRARLAMAILAGVYCLIPMTEFIPLATVVSAFARFEEHPRYRKPADPE